MSHGRRALLCGLCATLLTVLLLAVDGRRQSSEERAELSQRSELRHLLALAAELDRELLRCRGGLTPHHDDLARAFEELHALQQRLLRAPEGLGLVPGPELSAALLRVSAPLASLLAALAALDVVPLPAALARLNVALDGLERASSPWAADTALLVQHGRAIAEHAPVVRP